MMILRALALCGGLAGAAGVSQYPEFSQQYLQRLAGQVDALDAVVADFEASAFRAGLTRGQALAELTGTPFLADRQADMRRTFRRHAVLTDNLATLRAASPLGRILMPQRVADPATFAATWRDFRPAMPLTVAGIASGGLGFVLGWAALRMLLGLILMPTRSRRPHRGHRAARGRRTEPAISRRHGGPGSGPGPHLAGVRRGPAR